MQFYNVTLLEGQITDVLVLFFYYNNYLLILWNSQKNTVTFGAAFSSL